MSGFVLDTGALIAVEKRDRRLLRLLELAREDAQPIDVPVGVVAQVWRGRGKQAVLATFLGLDDRVGAIRPGLDGDLVLWSGDPLDVMSRAEQVFISGAEVYRWQEGHGVVVERSERFDE